MCYFNFQGFPLYGGPESSARCSFRKHVQIKKKNFINLTTQEQHLEKTSQREKTQPNAEMLQVARNGDCFKGI